MPRRWTVGTAGVTFHVLNRGVRRLKLFDHDGDYGAFRNVMAATLEKVPVRMFAYCIMPNHFHLVCSPREDGQLSEFMRLMTVTHSKRWHAVRKTNGTGCVYQGRFKAFPVQTDGHFLTVCRYVERNALRARLVPRAEVWKWSSLFDRCKNCDPVPLSVWPILQPPTWLSLVNDVEPTLHAIRTSVIRSRPFGDDAWAERIATELRLTPSLNNIGRPLS